ncbi:NAD(+) diphosphatase [Zhihengliuella flava]|uniref:NAD(+) diphosphatase n=1 Tax=Zhihengliuella flava TaxID=1285193 RepID=A0A931GFT0_9MICC|nr:NAD(+) diphosphatase [Zhihengliuella flava]MBG6085580.1 NAD+ diphosphatase [Zhihengliuella flava]
MESTATPPRHRPASGQSQPRPDAPPYRVDRLSEERAREGWMEEVLADDRTLYLPLRPGQGALGVESLATDRALQMVERSVLPAGEPTLHVYLGRVEDLSTSPAAGRHVVAIVHPGAVWGQWKDAGHDGGARWAGLRALAPVLEAAEAELLTQATAIAAWHAGHTHCPRCGAPTTVVQSGWVRLCPQDSSQHFPRTDPAIIVSVIDDQDRILLGANARWGGQRYSTLAGFVEPGETLEAAVIREVGEEAGIVVSEPAYVSSQSWPFPASIMLAFTARATQTSVRPDGEEIIALRWFTRAELAAAVRAGDVTPPTPLSVARHLIENWYGSSLPEPQASPATDGAGPPVAGR